MEGNEALKHISTVNTLEQPVIAPSEALVVQLYISYIILMKEDGAAFDW